MAVGFYVRSLLIVIGEGRISGYLSPYKFMIIGRVWWFSGQDILYLIVYHYAPWPKITAVAVLKARPPKTSTFTYDDGPKKVFAGGS